MSDVPLTRPSLLLRIRGGDREAWREFVALYGPLVYQFARSRRLQDADAADVVQRVFQAISQAMPHWPYDPQQGRFRSWLLGVTRNQVGKHLKQARRNGRTLVDRMTEVLVSHGADGDQEAEAWEREFQLRAFRFAADHVRLEFTDASWQAFWRTAVEGQSAMAVGESLGLSVGAVYTARSRVLSRIKATVAEFDDQDILFIER